MRLWFVDPKFLPDSLLVRQHQSSHGLMMGIAAGRARRGVTRYLRYGGFVAWVHNWTADEMRSRGMRHESPLIEVWQRIPADRRRYDYPVTRELVARDKALITAKFTAVTAHESCYRSALPIHLAGLEFIERQRQMIANGGVAVRDLVI